MRELIRIFVGFDPREAIAYHVCCQSILESASMPVAFIPLHAPLLDHFDSDGSNAFTLSRYLIPYLCDFTGWALYLDGDMVVTRDIAQLWALRERACLTKAVSVVKHLDYIPHPRKYLGTTMESANPSYPRKNWSSVMLWNCSHFGNRGMTPEYVQGIAPQSLHRFEWLAEQHLGELPREWNHLVGEVPAAPAALYHFTLGIPAIPHYAHDFGSARWKASLKALMEVPHEVSELSRVS